MTRPFRRSELREALDAATGHGQDERDDVSVPDPATGQPNSKKRTLRWLAAFFAGVLSNALGGILTILIVALAIFLWTHSHAGHSPANHLPIRSTAAATTQALNLSSTAATAPFSRLRQKLARARRSPLSQAGVITCAARRPSR
ncbi:MAG: hypothetical protein M3Z75_13720 [Actinomycetota bacterium]|nr:hypothetical protein [Actinomycetota bacterium]